MYVICIPMLYSNSWSYDLLAQTSIEIIPIDKDSLRPANSRRECVKLLRIRCTTFNCAVTNNFKDYWIFNNLKFSLTHFNMKDAENMAMMIKNKILTVILVTSLNEKYVVCTSFAWKRLINSDIGSNMAYLF